MLNVAIATRSEMRLIESTTWSKDRMDRLQVLYFGGISFSLIAADLGVTRSAAIGKARRMRLPKRGETIQKAPRKASPSRRYRRQIARRPGAIPPAIEIDDGRDYRCSILDLSESTCRYPIWDVGTPHSQRLYCGAPGASFSQDIPYCHRHSQLCGGAKLYEAWPSNLPRSLGH